jgi:hypothetical protein
MAGVPPPPPVTIDWGQILSIIVGSAALSAIISAIISHFMTLREIRKKRDMEFVRQKLNLYSRLIYQLDDMRHHYNALATADGNKNPEENYAFSVDEWDKIVDTIDGIIKDDYLLLNPKVHEKWTWAKTLHVLQEGVTAMRDMREMLAVEYNQIREKHLRSLSDIVPAVPVDEKPTPK